MAVTITIIKAVAITSTPANDGDVYGFGETIRVALTFDQEVEAYGDVAVSLALGDSSREAGYESGNGSDTLVFGYTVRTPATAGKARFEPRVRRWHSFPRIQD